MSPLSPKNLRAVVVPLLIGVTLIAGCAKKPVATPTPAPTPPQVETPVPPPTSTPAPQAETPPAPSAVKSEDFQPAFFDYDAYSLRDDARAVLDRNARTLRDNPKVGITIEGHCDERGTVEYNQALGERRAQVARDYLVAAGIDASRINLISYGKERPFATGQDEASWQQNRRAHFVVRGTS
ncbi:MAG: peptidoglycan-associated lipoprotein Pal [Candidatus Eisenbacteria bacterium]